MGEFLVLSYQYLETPLKNLIAVGIFCRPLATYYPSVSDSVLILMLYKSVYLLACLLSLPYHFLSFNVMSGCIF